MDASALDFIDLTPASIAFLLFVGFVGGLIQGMRARRRAV